MEIKRKVGLLFFFTIFILFSPTIVEKFFTNDFSEDYFLLLGRPNISEEQIIKFLIKNNPNLARSYVKKIAKIYCTEAEYESINTAIAVAQMALETAFLRFNGTIQKGQNNFAGIGSVNNSHQGAFFRTIEEGIRAHIQHLKAYASSFPLSTPCIDPRRKFVQNSKFFGKLKTVHDLTGTWAIDKNYGKKIEKLTYDLINSE